MRKSLLKEESKEVVRWKKGSERRKRRRWKWKLGIVGGNTPKPTLGMETMKLDFVDMPSNHI